MIDSAWEILRENFNIIGHMVSQPCWTKSLIRSIWNSKDVIGHPFWIWFDKEDVVGQVSDQSGVVSKRGGMVLFLNVEISQNFHHRCDYSCRMFSWQLWRRRTRGVAALLENRKNFGPLHLRKRSMENIETWHVWSTPLGKQRLLFDDVIRSFHMTS